MGYPVGDCRRPFNYLCDEGVEELKAVLKETVSGLDNAHIIDVNDAVLIVGLTDRFNTPNLHVDAGDLLSRFTPTTRKPVSIP